jgi:hypothetical protein
LGMLLFYLVKTFCDALGEKGIVSEWLASGIPYALIIIIAICHIRQNR